MRIIADPPPVLSRDGSSYARAGMDRLCRTPRGDARALEGSRARGQPQEYRWGGALVEGESSGRNATNCSRLGVIGPTSMTTGPTGFTTPESMAPTAPMMKRTDRKSVV